MVFQIVIVQEIVFRRGPSEFETLCVVGQWLAKKICYWEYEIALKSWRSWVSSLLVTKNWGLESTRLYMYIFLWMNDRDDMTSIMHYNNKRLFCNPHIIANNKERSSQKQEFANHNSSQTLNLLRYNNIRARTIASPSQLPNLIPSQNVSDYNCFYIQFAINITSETICNKPIPATT
jgi:hypothetical protein